MGNKQALHITKDAKDSTFMDCNIQGVQNDGTRTSMVRTKIYNFHKNHPSLWVSIVIALFVGVILLLIEYGYFVK